MLCCYLVTQWVEFKDHTKLEIFYVFLINVVGCSVNLKPNIRSNLLSIEFLKLQRTISFIISIRVSDHSIIKKTFIMIKSN